MKQTRPRQWEREKDSVSLMKDSQVPVGNTNFSFKGEANVGSRTPAPLEKPSGERDGKEDSVNDKWTGEERAKPGGRRHEGEAGGRRSGNGKTHRGTAGGGQRGAKRKEKAEKTGPRLCRLAHRLPVRGQA